MRIQFIKSVVVVLAVLMINVPIVLASESMLRDFLANIDRLSADFDQKIVDESGMTLDQARGKVYLQRPGKFRWNYAGEDSNVSLGQQLVADGESIFLFDPDLEQVTKRSLKDAINQVPSLLLVQDGDGNLVPGVAESYEASDGNKTYTFKLRQNAKWSNGDPVTAHDFVYAWQRAEVFQFV